MTLGQYADIFPIFFMNTIRINEVFFYLLKPVICEIFIKGSECIECTDFKCTLVLTITFVVPESERGSSLSSPSHTSLFGVGLKRSLQPCI